MKLSYEVILLSFLMSVAQTAECKDGEPAIEENATASGHITPTETLAPEDYLRAINDLGRRIDVADGSLREIAGQLEETNNALKVMSQNTERNWFDNVSDPMIVILTLLAVFVAYQVHLYSKRRDSLLYNMEMWNFQQRTNHLQISNKKLLDDFENLVYGHQSQNELDKGLRYFNLFLYINKVLLIRLGAERKLIKKTEADKQIYQTMRLLVREEKRVKYLLDNRGYDQEFAKWFIEELKKVEGPVKEEVDDLGLPSRKSDSTSKSASEKTGGQ